MQDKEWCVRELEDMGTHQHRSLDSGHMTVLMPAALLSMVLVLFLSFSEGPRTFYLTIAGFALFLAALLITIIVEVPIVKQIETWRVSNLPGNWQELRDRWLAFRVI